MKKLVSILLTLAIVFAMSATAFAAEEETFNLTINGIKDHTYKVFQIYTGDVAEEGDTLVLSNVKYGKNHVPFDGQTGDLVPKAELQAFLNAADQANYFKSQISGDAYATINPDGTEESVTIPVAAGYYLIVDVTTEDQLPDGQTKSPVILKVAETTVITSKHASIISHKKVKDKNDTTGAVSTWQDSADYDIGDAVPFQLSVTLPTTLNSYATYPLTFHDDQDIGFDAPADVKVYIQRGDAVLFEVTDGYTVSNECVKDDTCEFGGCDFCVAVTDVKALYAAAGVEFAKDDALVVEYTSVLNTQATSGRVGNENHMYVCHPDGHTPIDSVTVLTYELVIHKIDGTTQTPLNGAGFTLQKKVNGVWVDVGTEVIGSTDFTWSGLDDGEYQLIETTVPATYNDIANILFVIEASHKVTWLADGNYAFEWITAHNTDGTANVFLDKNAEGLVDGILEGTVENYKGAILPETGAEGTFFLITGGALLVVVACVFMITRKKMSIYED